jgi:hypothetical protein
MAEIIYNPLKVGSKSLNSRGKYSRVRKYHLTDEEKDRAREKWLLEVKDIDPEIKSKAHSSFFNPYRHGIYYYQVQVLYLLGSNEWHGLSEIIRELESYTSQINLKDFSVFKERGSYTAWDKFRGKSSREGAVRSKDYLGRIQENYIMLQRLSMLHPYGYKLHQACGAIDIKRITQPCFDLYFYRLSTYSNSLEAFPIKDFTEFEFFLHKNKYITNKFIGKIITLDGEHSNVK